MVIFTCIFVLITLVLSGISSVLLTMSMMSDEWEMLSYKMAEVEKLAESKSHFFQLLDRGLARLDIDQSDSKVVYLVPAHGGVLKLCPNVSAISIRKMKEDGYDIGSSCISYLSNEKIESRDAWLDRMRNLAMSCGIVCLILIAFCAPIGIAGALKKQISAVMVTGVMYILAGVFGVFSLAFMHFKRAKSDGYYTSTILDRNLPDEYMQLRVFSIGWPPSVEWTGLVLCFIGSLFWLLLAKLYRYQILSPIPGEA